MKKVFEKFFVALIVCFVSFGFINSARIEAAAKTILVLPVKNLAAETGKITAPTVETKTQDETEIQDEGEKFTKDDIAIKNIASILTEDIIDAVQDSAKFSAVRDSSSSYNYSLRCTITEIKIYDSKSDKQKVLSLLRTTLGKDADGNDDKSITEEDKNKASAELQELSRNPFSTKIFADVKVVDKDEEKVILSKNFSGDKFGSSKEYAVRNACQNLASEIISELSRNKTSEPEQIPFIDDEFEEIENTDLPETKTPEKKELAPITAEIFDTLNEDIIYIKKDSSTDLKVGEVLTIYRESGDLIIGDEVVGKKELAIGKAVVEKIYEKYSVCKITQKTEEIKVGDIVKRD